MSLGIDILPKISDSEERKRGSNYMLQLRSTRIPKQRSYIFIMTKKNTLLRLKPLRSLAGSRKIPTNHTR